MEKKDLDLAEESDPHELGKKESAEGIDRRAAFKVAGKMALYTAPAMVALLVTKKARAVS